VEHKTYITVLHAETRIMIRAQLDVSMFFLLYMIAIFISFLAFLISALLKHRRETRRLREKLRRLRENPERPWFEETD